MSYMTSYFSLQYTMKNVVLRGRREVKTIDGVRRPVAAILWGVLTLSLSGSGVHFCTDPPLFSVMLIHGL